MAYTLPTATEFRDYFVRDFPYSESIETGVTDADINKAINEAKYNLNEGLYGSQEQFTLAFLYLTAHYLVMDLRAASQGISGTFAWLQTSKSVGSVSVSSAIPQRILDNPELAIYSTTTYGVKYLSLLLPRLMGQVFTVAGWTRP